MKKILGIFILFVMLTICINNVNAYNMSFVASDTTVYVGDDINVAATLTSIEGRFSISSSNQGVLSGGKVTDWVEGGTITAWFHASQVGTATITISPLEASTMDPGNEQDYYETKSITVNVISRPQAQPIEINKTYSANNYLNGLAVTGNILTPEFDKDVLEYNLEVDYTVEKINVEASSEDNTAVITGMGEHEVSEGNNEILIVVTAENGNERIYKINVLVKEMDPIEVTIDKEKYTVVKKDTLLKELENYQKTTIKINDKEVPALKGKKTNYTLVGLKDSKGNINLYIYDSSKNTYTKYQEIEFSGVSIYPMEKDKEGYKKTIIKINGSDVTSYKKKGFNYYLVYGMNLDTGKVNWYTYDSEEKTLQRYLESDNISKEKSDDYLFLIYILSGVIGLLIIFIMILFIKYKKK